MQGYWGICGALIGVALLTAPAHGQDGVAECIQMQSSLQRLDCYDRLFRGPLTAPAETKVNRKAPPPAAKLPPPTPPAVAQTIITGTIPKTKPGVVTNSNNKSAKFQTRPEPDPELPESLASSWVLKKAEAGTLVATSSKRVHRNLVGHRSRLTLEIACRNNTTSLELKFGGNIVASFLDTAQLRFHVDDRPAVTYQFSVADDFKAVGLWRGQEAIPIIKSLMGATTLTVEGVP
ncbi:MAG: hypothetical protein AAGF86_07035, partial [Pseudomonadota bacterium]